MNIYVCAFLSLYVGLTSERNADLTQIKSKSLDILADNEINSDGQVHNVNRKNGTFSLNMTKHNSVNYSNSNRNSTKLQNYTTAQTLQNDFKNVSMYEHVQDKQNDINERSFVFIDTKFKVPFHHQNMLKINYEKSIIQDYNNMPHVRPWDSSLNYKDSPQNFLEGRYKGEPLLKLYVDPYNNPSTAYVQSYDDYYKLNLNNALSQELRNLEKKVKAADALIDYQYSDIKSQDSIIETNPKDSVENAQENREYFNFAKMPAVGPDTIMMKNKINQHVKTTDVLDRYKIYGHPHQILPNDYTGNIFDHKTHQSGFHDRLSMSTFQQPQKNQNYFSNSIRTSNDHINGNNDMYLNNDHLAVKPNIQSSNDFVNKFDHEDTYDNRINNPQNDNHWKHENHMSYANIYVHPVDRNMDSKYLKNIDASYDAPNTDAKSLISESSLKYSHLPHTSQNEMNNPYLKSNGFRTNDFASEFATNKPATSGQNKNNIENDRDSNDQSRKSFYLTNKLSPNYDGDDSNKKYSPKSDQADYKKSYSDDKRNRISKVDSIRGKLQKNNYFREKYRPNIEPKLNNFAEDVLKTNPFQSIDERPVDAPVSYKPTTTDNVITQDDNPTIEIQHPDSKNNYLTIKFHPKEPKDRSPVIKIHPPTFNEERKAPSKDSGSYNKATDNFETLMKQPVTVDRNVQSEKFAAKSIEIYPKLNEIYPYSKGNDWADSNESKSKYRENMIKDKVYKKMQHHVINKPPPPDLSENEVTLALQQKDNVFKQLNEKLTEINKINLNKLRVTSERTEKIHDDCMMNTLIRRITNKSVVVTPKPFRESCVYPECMEKAILNSDPNNPTCECEYAIKQNMSKNSDYGDLDLPVPASHENSSSSSH